MDSEAHEEYQRFVDTLFRDARSVDHLDAQLVATAMDLSEPLMEVVRHIPPGVYRRPQLADLMNTKVVARGYGRIFGTVD